MPVSKSDDWATPNGLFDEIWDEFGPIDLDCCGAREHHYSAYRIATHGGGFFDGSTEAMDGLVQPWYGTVFMNPPYNAKALAQWVPKADAEVNCGNAKRVVALLPAKKTEQGWWQEFVLPEYHRDGSWVNGRVEMVRFLDGRIRFKSGKTAPFSSCLVVFSAMPERGRGS